MVQIEKKESLRLSFQVSCNFQTHNFQTQHNTSGIMQLAQPYERTEDQTGWVLCFG